MPHFNKTAATVLLTWFAGAVVPMNAQTQLYETAWKTIQGQHLPLPGKAPGWPFASIGKWTIDVQGNITTWRQEAKDWRKEQLIRMGYDDAEYRRPELQWSQRNFVHVQMMVEDRYFYDPVAARYTVDRYLDDLEARYGGVDSVLIWYVYPNIGIDDRNQFDHALTLPGGLPALKQVVADFHRRGVKVFLPTFPSENGTRDQGTPDWQAITQLVAAVHADAVHPDTYYGAPRAFRLAAEAAGLSLVLQAESGPLAEEGLMWNNQSWGKASTETIPAVSKLKWLEPRHIVNVENRMTRDKTDDFQYIFFNGHGYTTMENLWGIWDQFTPRDAEALRRIATIDRQFAPWLVSLDWEPYACTLQSGVFSSKFPGAGSTLWTIVNRNEYDLAGDQLVVPHREGQRYYDVWHGTALTPRIRASDAVLALPLEGRGYGAVLAVEKGASVEGLDAFLAKMEKMTKEPLKNFSSVWRPLPQQMVAIKPTGPIASAPAGMVPVPAGEFDFRVTGIELEGNMWEGLDFQYPWEPSARRTHQQPMKVKSFFIDRHPVTNADYRKFMDASGYQPKDPGNFLRDWRDRAPQPGWENKPVTWVSLEDARAYAAWAGKRLPHEWEWQYAAQGTDGRLYPWGDDWRPAALPKPNRGRTLLPPDDVDAHPDGASPFGVMDLVGNVWQWTDEFSDDHTRAAALRGGSAYQPQTCYWYFPQAYRLDQHGKYLLMAPSHDRSGMIGFRCVVDTP